MFYIFIITNWLSWYFLCGVVLDISFVKHYKQKYLLKLNKKKLKAVFNS